MKTKSENKKATTKLKDLTTKSNPKGGGFILAAKKTPSDHDAFKGGGGGAGKVN